MFKIILHKDAAKFYGKSSKNWKKRLNHAIDQLEENPYYGVHIKKMKGQKEEYYSYRIGDIRIIYEIHQDINVVKIVDIGPRGDIYK